MNNFDIPFDFSTDEDLPYNYPFSMDELETSLSDTNNSSPGLDDVPYEMIRQLSVESQSALQVFNSIRQTGIYPDQWREAIVIPLLKPGKDKQKPSSCRPISLTCCLSKILEIMVNQRLIWISETNNYIAKEQTGFRKYHSTMDYLVNFENAIQHAFISRQHLVAVSFDIEKAFDMSWRNGILEKLQHWGLRGNLPNFIKSFLDDRSFRVRIQGSLSSRFMLENGVPQGSTISVTLFLIAINDLISTVIAPLGKCLYVDDLIIFMSGYSIQTINWKIQSGVNTIVDEAEKRGFRFSEAKTRCIHFCRLRKLHREPSLFIKGTPIQNVERIRLLGLTFDKKLTWKPHIEDLTTRCKQTLNILKCISNIKWGADKEILLRLYKSLILSKNGLRLYCIFLC